MKRIISMMLASLLVLTLSACANIANISTSSTTSGDTATADNNNTAQTIISDDTTEAVADEDTDTTEGQALYEDDSILIERHNKDVEEIYTGQAMFYFRVKNKTDKDLLVGLGNLGAIAVNDSSLQSLGSSIVKAGKTGVVSASFRMDYAGVDDVNDINYIDFAVTVFDNETMQDIVEIPSIIISR